MRFINETAINETAITCYDQDWQVPLEKECAGARIDQPFPTTILTDDFLFNQLQLANDILDAPQFNDNINKDLYGSGNINKPPILIIYDSDFVIQYSNHHSTNTLPGYHWWSHYQLLMRRGSATQSIRKSTLRDVQSVDSNDLHDAKFLLQWCLGSCYEKFLPWK